MWQCCQTELYFVIPSVLGPRPSVSWLASAYPLEVWHPLHSDSICQRSLLHFTALRQVTAPAPKYSLQAEIRGRLTRWQRSDQSRRTQTSVCTQEAWPAPPEFLEIFWWQPLIRWNPRTPPPPTHTPPTPHPHLKNPAQLPPWANEEADTWRRFYISIVSSSPVMWVSFVLLPSMHSSRHGGGVFWFCRQTALLRAGGRAKRGGWASAQMDD